MSPSSLIALSPRQGPPHWMRVSALGLRRETPDKRIELTAERTWMDWKPVLDTGSFVLAVAVGAPPLARRTTSWKRDRWGIDL